MHALVLPFVVLLGLLIGTIADSWILFLCRPSLNLVDQVSRIGSLLAIARLKALMFIHLQLCSFVWDARG
jgi:hypothetical protein